MEIRTVQNVTFLVFVVRLYHDQTDKYHNPPLEIKVFSRIIQSADKYDNQNLILMGKDGDLLIFKKTEYIENILLNDVVFNYALYDEQTTDHAEYDLVTDFFMDNPAWNFTDKFINLKMAMELVNNLLTHKNI